jgi:neurotransmitter:Na+ symporter, NSS family
MKRERWGSRSFFIMAAIGSAIGLGNVWRFPYVVYSNGGGAFLIPYFIALITTGIPLMAFEYYLGIRFQKGPSEAYGHLKKKTNYIGWFSVLVSFVITIYYTVVMGWAWNYLYYSFGVKWAGVEKNFFFEQVLSISQGPGILGNIQWGIVFGNLLTWVLIYLILFKGLKVVGKVVNYTVALPWILLILILIRAVTLDGALAGLDFYLKPDFSKLKDINVWLAAYGQIFFSLSLGFGIMVAYASFMPKKSDITTNAWVVSFANCLTSFVAGFAVFATLGYLAHTMNQPIEQVAGAGVGLAFVAFPTAISNLPGGIIVQSLFAIIFFLTLLTLGIDSAFSLIEAVTTSLSDTFKINKSKATLVVCIIGFLLGTIFTTRGGLYWLDIVDRWMNCFGLIVVGFLEAFLVGWLCDTNKIEKDINSTSEIKLGKFWYICIKWITPVVLGIIIIFSIFKEFNNPYEGYNTWALILGGWMLILTLFYLALILQKRHVLKEKIKNIYKVAGYLIIYVGLIYNSCMLYISPNKMLYAIISLAILCLGAYLIKIKGEQKKKLCL